MKKILLPTDGSELSDYAYQLASKIAAETGADLEILSIVPAPAGAFFDKEGNLKSDEGENFADVYQERVYLEEQIERWMADKPDIAGSKVKIGTIEEDIVAYAKASNIDLLVMGTHGAHGWTQVLHGSHTAHVVRTSPVPVLCLKCDRSQMSIRNILLVSDFEEVGELDLRILKDLQTAFDARLHLLRINTPKNFKTDRMIKKNMQQFVDLNGLEKVSFHLYSDDSVEAGIVNFGLEHTMDIVAMGTHQRNGLSRMFKHSISEDVVHHLMQPVLTFRV